LERYLQKPSLTEKHARINGTAAMAGGTVAAINTAVSVSANARKTISERDSFAFSTVSS
jgi:hypothetical protein